MFGGIVRFSSLTVGRGDELIGISDQSHSVLRKMNPFEITQEKEDLA